MQTRPADPAGYDRVTMAAAGPDSRLARRLKDIGRSVVRVAAMSTADLRVLPDVVIIGVKRGGTTSLFRDLETHPSMCPLVPSARRMPMRENMKGVHYFDTNFTRSARWYRSHFATRFTRRRREQATGAAFTAEASPYYLFQPGAAERAAALLPETTRFVILLRDPVERTVSHWSEQTRNGVETLSLSEALAAESHRIGDDAERLASGTIETSHAHEQQSYAAQSCYADSVRRWIDAVGADRLLIRYSEDYYRDPAAIVDAITTSLGIETRAPEVGEHRNAAPRASALDAALDAELTERFRSDVDALEAMLGHRPPWPRFAAPVDGGGGR